MRGTVEARRSIAGDQARANIVFGGARNFLLNECRFEGRCSAGCAATSGGLKTGTSDRSLSVNGDSYELGSHQGNWKQVEGRVKEQWGKLTDDDLDVIAGRRDQLAGKIQERYGTAKDDVEKQPSHWESSADDSSFEKK